MTGSYHGSLIATPFPSSWQGTPVHEVGARKIKVECRMEIFCHLESGGSITNEINVRKKIKENNYNERERDYTVVMMDHIVCS